MTGRRSHGRLSALNGVVHQGTEDPQRDGGLLGAVLCAQARGHGAGQSQALLRCQQPRQQARVRWRTFLTPGANSNDPATEDDFGDALLLRLGYTYVDAGWQGNLAPGNSRLIPDLPVGTEPDGRPIVANVRVEFADASGFSRSLEGNSDHVSRVPYEPVDLDPSHATLTVRGAVDGPKTPVPSSRWAFGRCQRGAATLVPTTTDLCLFDGFKSTTSTSSSIAQRIRVCWALGMR